MNNALLNSKEILKIESRFSSLIERTFFKGTLGQRAPVFKDSVSKWFKSKTFEKQMDSIIDDTCLFSAQFTDNQIKMSLNSSLPGGPPRRKLSAAYDTPLLITDEAVIQAEGLAAEVVDSIVIMLKDEGLYKAAPATLERRVRDLWGGEKYRATRFVRTFTADIATTTAVHRYKQNEVDMQFYAKIDGRTSPQCRMLHGSIFRYDSPEISLYRCPLHHFCRSAIIPYPSSLEMDTNLLFENRNFSKQMNQNFSFSENEVDSKVIKKVFKDIGTFNEKYRISQFILDEDIEKRLTRLGVGVNIDVPKVKAPAVKTPKVKTPKAKTVIKEPAVPKTPKENTLVYTPVKTINEAETWLKNNTKLNHVDFSGVDPSVANSMSESLAYHYNLVPKMKDRIQYFGTIEKQLDLDYERRFAVYTKQLQENGIDRTLAEQVAKKKTVRKTSKAYAHSMDVTANGGDYTGIGVGKTYGGNPKMWLKRLKENVTQKWHPVKCDTPKAVLDHEFGHVIDDIYGIALNPKMKTLYDSLPDAKMKTSVSTYASTNINEFIAEAWSEYINNPTPRPVSKEVGDFILSKIKGDKK